MAENDRPKERAKVIGIIAAIAAVGIFGVWLLPGMAGSLMGRAMGGRMGGASLVGLAVILVALAIAVIYYRRKTPL